LDRNVVEVLIVVVERQIIFRVAVVVLQGLFHFEVSVS
jgi:hypothetical protein